MLQLLPSQSHNITQTTISPLKSASRCEQISIHPSSYMQTLDKINNRINSSAPFFYPRTVLRFTAFYPPNPSPPPHQSNSGYDSCAQSSPERVGSTWTSTDRRKSCSVENCTEQASRIRMSVGFPVRRGSEEEVLDSLLQGGRCIRVCKDDREDHCSGSGGRGGDGVRKRLVRCFRGQLAGEG